MLKKLEVSIERFNNFLFDHKIFFLSVIIFILAFSFRVWNLGNAGQVWDENSLLVNYAYKHVSQAINLDFGNEFWWKGTPDHPPLVRYLRGAVSLLDIEKFENGVPVYTYDMFYNRMLSVILTSLAAVLVFLVGARYISAYVGFSSGMIFAMLPIPLGHSQIAMLEAISLFFFTLSMYTFFLFLEKSISTKRIIIAGIALGLAVLTRETHLMLLPIFILIIFIKNFKAKKNNLKQEFKKFLFIILIAFITFFLLWPMPFFHLDYLIKYTLDLRFSSPTPVPEVFFGKLMLVPIVYYFFYFIITTPFMILLLALIGLKKIDKSKNWILYSIVLWFSFPFILSFYPKREQGIRYIIQICAPLAILAALGFETLVNKLTKKVFYKLLAIVALFIYLLIILIRITPYYIDYFNVLVGGAKGVYEKKLFHLAWWGEGSLEAMNYLAKNAPIGASIGLATTPSHTFPPLPKRIVEPYNPNKKYDYVIVNFYNVVRIGFDDSQIKRDYEVVYSVMADGAHLYEVYKRK